MHIGKQIQKTCKYKYVYIYIYKYARMLQLTLRNTMWLTECGVTFNIPTLLPHDH